VAVSRNEILGRLRAQVEAGKPIIGCGAGTGISAKFAEAGGADLLIIYNSGRYRMAGRSSLAGFFAYGDANSIVMEMAGEVLPIVQHTPVLAGVNGTDPFKIMPHFLRQVKEIGFSGVQNFPTMGMFDGIMRANMEATGLGYDKEVEMIRMAHEMDMFTSPYVFNADEARWMVEAGGDLIVCHVGLTTAGSIGASVAMTLDDAINKTMTMAEAVWSLKPDALVICHGGPFDEPDNVAAALQRMPKIAGFYGASSAERLPTERAIRSQVAAFKAIRR